MLVKWSLILVFYITDPRQLVQCVAGDDVEESFYLNRPGRGLECILEWWPGTWREERRGG